MSKHLTFESEVHGPKGREIIAYTEENIAALWELIPERINALAGTNVEYTGTVTELTEYPVDKLLYFKPHLTSGHLPKLRLNALPLLPLLKPDGITPVADGYFRPEYTYDL